MREPMSSVAVINRLEGLGYEVEWVGRLEDNGRVGVVMLDKDGSDIIQVSSGFYALYSNYYLEHTEGYSVELIKEDMTCFYYVATIPYAEYINGDYYWDKMVKLYGEGLCYE